MRLRYFAATLGAAVLLAGCGSGEDVRQIQPQHAPNLSLIDAVAGSVHAPAAESPEAFIKERDPKPIVVGAVEGIEEGRVIYDGPPETAAEEPDAYLVMVVRVSETVRDGEPGQIYDGRVYVEIHQGGMQIQQDGSLSPRFSLSEWREAIPAGTRVMLFLEDFDYAKANEFKTDHEDRGVPDGAQRMIAGPQGMIFEYDGQIVGHEDESAAKPLDPWEAKSIDELSAQVREYLGN